MIINLHGIGMEEIFTQVIYQLGSGGALGFIVGYSVKKVAKILAVIAGLFTLALILLQYIGFINIHYDKLLKIVNDFMKNLGQSSDWITPIIANLPFGGSFIVGAALGFKMG